MGAENHLVEIALPGGTSVWFEASPATPARTTTTRGGGVTENLAVAQRGLAEAFSGISPAISALIGELRSIGDGVDSIEAEFGLRVSAEVGFIVVKGGGESNFRVLVRWQRPR